MIKDEMREIMEMVADGTIDQFLNWLYETCPVNPDEVPRKKLKAMYVDHRNGLKSK